MAEADLHEIRRLLAACTADEQRVLFNELRASQTIHELETAFGATAEVMLEAIHRAPELTRRMLRGVIADAAFARVVVPRLAANGWRDVTPSGNFAYDHLLEDDTGRISVQVKLQRSEQGRPVVTTGTKFGLEANMYLVECQRTRSGTSRVGNSDEDVDATRKTRPYRYGDFDVLAVSLQPSTGDWGTFRYTVGDWLLPGSGTGEIATYQPVALGPDGDDWTDDFVRVADWLRAGRAKRIGGGRSSRSRPTGAG